MLGPALALTHAQDQAPASSGAETTAQVQANWSADMLANMLKEPDKAPASLQDEGFRLTSYQLRSLRVGEARVQNLIGVLQKLLPAGSTVRPDNRDNKIHVLTTPTAHAASADFIAAVDDNSPATLADPPLTAEMRQAFAKLEKMGDSAKVVTAVDNVRTSFDRRFADIAATQKHITNYIIFGGVGIFAIIAASVLIHKRRSRADTEADALAQSTALSIMTPEKVSTALAPFREEMQERLMATLNEAAVRLEQWSNQRKSEQEQLMAVVQRQAASLEEAQGALTKTRQQYIEAADTVIAEQRQVATRLAASNERIENTVQAIQVQTNKTEAIAEELKITVRDLDRARDEQMKTLVEIEKLRDQLQSERNNTEDLRRDLARKEQELTKQQATLASLQILLEDDRPLPPGALEEQYKIQAARISDEPPLDGAPSPRVDGSAAAQFPVTIKTTDFPPSSTPCRFKFLPVDR